MALAVTLPLALTACEDHSPVAAPTSTLPAQDPADDSSSETDKPSIPEYDTELDLNDEEKEAVEGALVAFEGFVSSIDSAYSGDFDQIAKFPEFARGDALVSIQEEAESVRSGATDFEGHIEPISVDVFDVSAPGNSKESSSVILHFCVDTSNWSMTPAGNSPTSNPDGKVTMEHQILLEDETWKVDQQDLWERKC
ncbi:MULTISPECIES: hypothetical protein [unclassified Brevibacterium]|uniref:hypothetical protein n=1 Tax=unclassified Brevibacterium TaxID=2614124 RepID=UPI001E2D8772|nr:MULTISPECIES: hypothetical protein [unclassified Brevibacterium]MCD1284561.1 hypothetical protein [Brevibacterium sp. CCUG 69071]MDK8435822.1 hypothetical protein [Brevibacterium sp. H-BE7]